MYKVLIVEDEMLVRLGLKASINWKKFNMEVVADVANGKEALEVYEKQKPDLILTDIKMPIMDGMKLIEKIREQDSFTKIVILSCLEEFDLVRKAMSQRVSDYILKLSMSQSDIESVLEKLQIELENSNIPKVPTENVKVEDGIIKEKILKEYLFYSLYSEAEFALQINKLKLRINPERLRICVMEIDHFELMQKSFKDAQGQLIKFSILNILDELLGIYKRGEACHEKDNRYFILISFQDIVSEKTSNEIVLEILQHIKRVIKSYYNATVTFGISSIENGYASLKKMYKECTNLLEQKFYLGTGLNFFPNKINFKIIENEVNSKLEQFLEDKNILGEEYHKELEARIHSFSHNFAFSKADIQKVILGWVHWTTHFLNLNGNQTSLRIIDNSERILQCETLDEVVEVYKRFLYEIKALLQKQRAFSKEIAEAIEYIQKNYKQDISVQQVADYVELSPNYLSNLFKKEMQLSFVEYLTQVRLNKAKELLLDTHLKSYEIANIAGFSDDSYFSRTFKKYTGLRPNEFRRKWLPEDKEGLDEEDL